MKKILRNGKLVGFYMPEAEYINLREEYCGLCLACGEVKDGGVEPDASRYKCDECGRAAVEGIENLLMKGAIRLHPN